jgi:hypothetical protein
MLSAGLSRLMPDAPNYGRMGEFDEHVAVEAALWANLVSVEP